MTQILPSTIADKTPGSGFTKLSIPFNEGIHTGGVFLSPSGTYRVHTSLKILHTSLETLASQGFQKLA